MTSLENRTIKYSDLISEIETGQVKIPQFQRQFVWSLKESAKLVDSLIKGYPIGTFIYWSTDERLRSIRNLGDIKLQEPEDGKFVNYVLDGQQRLTSLFAAFKGLKVIDGNNKEIDYSNMYIKFKSSEHEEIVVTDCSLLEENTYIRVTELMEGSFKVLASYPEEYHDLLDKYKKIIQSFSFSIINLKNATIDIATEVFTRLNVGGRALTLFEIMVAKTYDDVRKFDLSVKYDALMEELKGCHYETISSATVLQVVAILLEKDCTRNQILKLEKIKIIDIWDEAMDCIKQSVDFFRGYGIPVSRILPYNALIVPFSYFFYKYKQNPTGEMKSRLEDFFWRASLGNRYSSSVESKLAQDTSKIDNIVEGKLPKYEWAVNVNEEFVNDNGWFSTGRAFIKAILCLYAKQKPKSFDNNQDVIIDNSWLKVASSKNYHHFFPKAWLKKKYPDYGYFTNHIVNITIVDDFLNKRIIKAKSPLVYMKKFNSQNEELKKTMKTHMIDVDKDGIWDNDFDLFFDNRLKRITKALNKFIIPQESVSGQTLIIHEDIEEEVVID